MYWKESIIQISIYRLVQVVESIPNQVTTRPQALSSQNIGIYIMEVEASQFTGIKCNVASSFSTNVWCQQSFENFTDKNFFAKIVSNNYNYYPTEKQRCSYISCDWLREYRNYFSSLFVWFTKKGDLIQRIGLIFDVNPLQHLMANFNHFFE